MKYYYSTHQVAKMCHVSPGSVIRWVHEGKIKTAKTAGGHFRICVTDLIQFLRELNMPIPYEIEGFVDADKGLKVLVVDDEASVRGLLVKFFKRNFENVQIREAENGFQTGWLASRFKPNLILLDILMPESSGLEVCEHIKKMPALRGTKIIAMTGFGGAFLNEARKAGAHVVVSKPIRLMALKKMIDDLMAGNDHEKAA